jgi:hypothetical protein
MDGKLKQEKCNGRSWASQKIPKETLRAASHFIFSYETGVEIRGKRILRKN